MLQQAKTTDRYMVGVDVGGTFTDLVFVDGGGNVIIEKVPSTPADMSQGVLDGLSRADSRLKLDGGLLGSLDRFVHGTTVAANAFLERKGAHIGFITTKGLRDTLVMRRMFRENMYDTRVPEPVPLVSRRDIFEVDERIDRAGKIIRPLDEAGVRAIAAEIARRKISGGRDLFHLLIPQSAARTSGQTNSRRAGAGPLRVHLLRGLSRDPRL